MAIGVQQSASDINAWAGKIALDLEQTMTEIQHFEAFLAATPDATLETAPYRFAAADVSTAQAATSSIPAGTPLVVHVHVAGQHVAQAILPDMRLIQHQAHQCTRAEHRGDVAKRRGGYPDGEHRRDTTRDKREQGDQRMNRTAWVARKQRNTQDANAQQRHGDADGAMWYARYNSVRTHENQEAGDTHKHIKERR